MRADPEAGRARAPARGDAPVLAALAASAPLEAWSEASLEQSLVRPETRALVLERGSDVVGFALGRRVLDELQVLLVAVDARERRRGCARALLEALLAAERGTGATRATLDVRARNLPARRLYESLGFVQTGERPRFYADGASALLYDLNLA